MDLYLKKKIDEADVVSFDIFDTLVERYVNEPTDVFDLVELSWNQNNPTSQINNFKEKRIIAEKMSRKQTNLEEVTLVEIYSNLFKEYPNIKIDNLRSEEIRIEKAVCKDKDIGKEAYEYSLAKGKRIVFTSDMYLDKKDIVAILHQCGYCKYENLFLSSDLKKRKKTGSLYIHIIKELNVYPNNILHIGDNINYDINNANKYGINTYLINNFLNENCFWKNNQFQKNNHIIRGFISRKKLQNDFYAAGYEILGPLLFGFTEWLHGYIKKYDPDKIIFLARDGDIIKQFYENRYRRDKAKIVYAYASRRGLIVPTLWKNPNIKNIQESIHFNDHIRILDVLERIGIDVADNETMLLKHKEKLDIYIDALNLESNKLFNEIFDDVREKIFQNSKKEYVCALNYWKNIISNGENIFVIDIGWNGNLQRALHRIIDDIGDINIKGFYLGINPKVNNGEEMKGYMFSKNRFEKNYYSLNHFMPLFETFFMNMSGSLYKYDDSGQGYRLYDYEYINKSGMLIEEISAINKIRLGSLDFLEDFMSYYQKLGIEFTVNDAISNMFSLGLYPKFYATKLFGNFRFFNSSVEYLACSKDNKFNINDFLKSHWKIGYAKRYIHLNLNYYRIINLLKTIKNYRRKF